MAAEPPRDQQRRSVGGLGDSPQVRQHPHGLTSHLPSHLTVRERRPTPTSQHRRL